MDVQLSTLNPKPQRLAGPDLLHELVRWRPNYSGNELAVDFRDGGGNRQQLSYQDLHERSNALARHLASFRPSDSSNRVPFFVPVLIAQSPQLYITQLAILKAGGAFCPIVLDIPEERLRFILRDVSASLLVTTSDLRARLPDLDQVHVVHADEVATSDGLALQLAVPIKTTDPAYVMYTSGSTGQPKGVILSHSAATQALLAHDRHLSLIHI